MVVDEENVSRILVILSHQIRREILLILDEKSEQSFTDLMVALNIDTGKLSFHIRSLGGLIEPTQAGKYRLTRSGQHAVGLIKDLEIWAIEADVERKASAFQLASLKKRTYAYLIDFAVVSSIFLMAAIMTNILSTFLGSKGVGYEVNIVLYVSIFWIYSTLLEGFAGQSLGKRIIGLFVVRIDGKKVLYDNAGVRNIGKIFILLPLDLLVGTQLKDRRFIRYFDKFAGTTVVDSRFRVSDLEPEEKTETASGS